MLSEAFFSLGTSLGLPLRIVASSANRRNSYDTHVSVEVWLASENRWVLSDPTFEGYWTEGAHGPLLSALQIQTKVAAHHNTKTIFWHGDRGSAAPPLSSNYIDPTYLFRYLAYAAEASGFGGGYVVPRASEAFTDGIVVGVLPDVRIDSIEPGGRFPGTLMHYASSPQATPTRFVVPAYADRMVFQKKVQAGRAVVDLPRGLSAGFVEVDSGSGTWTVVINPAVHYALDELLNARVSPVFELPKRLELRSTGTRRRAVVLRVWTARRFPSSREILH
ncbi:MAG: hypothetical protein NVS1B9_01530 [Solirubrobacteraceae bacterium]